MRADEAGQIWPFDSEPVNRAVKEYRLLEMERVDIERRQASLRSEIREHRLAINAAHVAPQVEENLSDLLDLYRTTLHREGMGWEGRLEVGVLDLWASDVHGKHQANGTPWCWIGGINQIEWSERVGNSHRHMTSPEITTDQVFPHCERLGMIVTGWGSASGLRVGVSLVVRQLVEAGQGSASKLR